GRTLGPARARPGHPAVRGQADRHPPIAGPALSYARPFLCPLSAGRIDGGSDHARRNTVAVPAAALSRYRSNRKSTRLNSSHVKISYAVVCLTKKNVVGDTQAAGATA